MDCNRFSSYHATMFDDRVHAAAIVFVSALTLAQVGSAQNTQRDALVVVGVGASIDAELLDDLTEGLHFAVPRAAPERAFDFIPKERVNAKLGYNGPKSPGNCILDRECLRKVHKALGTRFFLLIHLKPHDGRFQIVVTRVGNAASDDVVKDGISPTGPAEFMNAARPLVLKALVSPRTTLSLSVNEQDATVEVDDKEVGRGSLSIQIRPGRYKIRVSKKGFIPFQTTVVCQEDQPCVVPANIFREPAKTVAPVPTAKPTTRTGSTPQILKITGWSTAGLGLALTITGIVFNAQSAATYSELEDACVDGVCSLSRAAAEDKRAQGEDDAALFNALGIPGLILTVGGVATAIVGHVLASGSKGEGSIEVTPALGPGGSSLLITRVRF